MYRLKEINMKKLILLFVLFFGMQAGPITQELKWHTNVKAISIGNKEHKPLMMFLQAAIGAGGV
jgi:protein disulfide-isomerase